MEQKIKLIVIGLIGALIAIIFLFLQTLGSKETLRRQKEKLVSENTALGEKFSKISKDYQRLEEMNNSLGKELDNAVKERESLQLKFEAAEKAKEDLTERMKSLKTETVARPEEPSAIPPADNYWAGILKAKTTLELQLENVRSELRSIQINNEQLQREKLGLDAELKNANLEKQDLKRQLEYNQKQLAYNQKIVDSLSLELVGEKNDKLGVSDNFKVLKNENLLLRRQLESLTKRKINMERKLQDLQEKNDTFEKKFSEMDVLLKDRTIQIEKLKKQMATGVAQAEPVNKDAEKNLSVELPPIVVRPQGADKPLKDDLTISGKILAINRDNNFAIIDLGDDSKIKVGDSFKVFRDNNQIAELEVIQTRKSISACDIKKENTTIKVGDIIK